MFCLLFSERLVHEDEIMLKKLLNFLSLDFISSSCDYLPKLLLLLVEWEPDICLVLKLLYFRMIISTLSTQKAIYVDDTKNKPCWVRNILSTVEKEFFLNIKWRYVKDNLTKDEGKSLTPWRRDILFFPDSDLKMRSQEKVTDLMLLINKLILLKLDVVNHKIERSSFAERKYDPTKKFILNSGPTNGFV